MNDARNVLDVFKDWPHEKIVDELDRNSIMLEIACENTLRDFNMGSIVRTANAFGIRRVHVIGRRQWNKRGAMMTDKYLEIVYYPTVTEFCQAVRPRPIIAIDNVDASIDIRTIDKAIDAILVFGAEGPGLSPEMLAIADAIVAIPQRGSTRSLNVGVAAGITMYEWLRQHELHDKLNS